MLRPFIANDEITVDSLEHAHGVSFPEYMRFEKQRSKYVGNIPSEHSERPGCDTTRESSAIIGINADAVTHTNNSSDHYMYRW